MAIYLYSCQEHGEFEEEHSINIILEECPKCKAEGKPPQKIKRLIAGGSNFILSGSGWAKDSYSK